MPTKSIFETQFRKVLLLGCASSAVIASSLYAPPAHAQAELSTQVETVTVTAEKRSENVQNVPLSIVALSGDKLASAGIKDVNDLQTLVPNLQINSISQAAGVTLRVRGFGTASNAAVDPDVAPYIDGVYIPRPGAILTSFLDVKSVEVLRGPQGTLFGRNATMGAISITTNAPSLDAKTLHAEAEIGSYGLRTGQLVANLPVSNTFAVRLAVTGSHMDGYTYNKLDKKRYGGSDQIAGRLSASWDITPTLNWTVRGDYALVNGDGYNYAPVDVATASAAQLAAFTARLGGNVPTLSDPPSFTANQRFDNPRLHDSQYGFNSDLKWQVAPDYSLRLIDSYRNWFDRQTDGDVVFTPLDLLNRHETFSSQSQSHELQFISSKGALLNHKLGFTSGLYYFSEDYSLAETLDLGSQFCSFIVAAAVPALVPACIAGPKLGATYSPFSQHAKSMAAYIQFDYQITPELELGLGARETHDEKTGSFLQTIANKSAAILRTPESDPNLKFSDTKPSWRANLSWHPTEDVMAFFTYSTGYKSGGLNSAPGRGIPLSRVFASETADDFELGVKSIWMDRKLLLNATVFQTKLHNFQDRSFNGLGFVVRNAGDVRARGVEVEGQFRPIEHLNINFGMDYLDSIYTKNTGAPGLTGCTGAANSCPKTQDLSGRTIPFAPKWSGNIGVELNSDPFMGGYSASLQVNTEFKSSFFTQNDLNPQSVAKARTLLGARLSLFSPDGHWQLDIYGKNLFDKRYVPAKFPQVVGSLFGVNDPMTGATLYRDYLGAPRTIGVRLSTNF